MLRWRKTRMYEVMMFDGGIYRYDEFEDLVDDLGGVVLQKSQMAQLMLSTVAVPAEDKAVVEDFAKELGGEIKEVPLAGTEIAVVGPTLGRHHMPHPICDIAEQLRQYGAITVVMGLARGRGKNTAQISTDEKAIINEYDATIFSLGNFKKCVEEKKHLFDDIGVPVVLVCGPTPEGLEDDCEGIVCGVGRKSERMRRSDEIEKLVEIANITTEVIRQRRIELEEDPLFIHPFEIKQQLEDLSAVRRSLRPAPVVLHLDGVRVKIPYVENRDELENIEVAGRRLGEVARITPSRISNSSTLIKIMTRSEIEHRDAQR